MFARPHVHIHDHAMVQDGIFQQEAIGPVEQEEGQAEGIFGHGVEEVGEAWRGNLFLHDDVAIG